MACYTLPWVSLQSYDLKSLPTMKLPDECELDSRMVLLMYVVL
jgi:hypothetical protein